MGGREGKKKKKGIKAKVTSKMGSKRKLSRMGKKVKAGLAGPSTEFMTRSMALRKLQVTLKDFRRLCILKGIYPRVPDKAPNKQADRIYYDIKDISYLQHEPLLEKFRTFKTFMKKVRKAAGRNEISEARRKNEIYKPDLSLNHLVKERYPRFVDALRDLDDALCMVHMFASLPSQGRVTAEKTKSCQDLTMQWQYYIAKSRTLKKVFVSVKGMYFQAEILGEPITWLTPHQFTQAFPKDVDFRVMLTFLEFYEVFLKFTMFKLYNLMGLNYPPTIDQGLVDSGSHLLSIRSTDLSEDQNGLTKLPLLEDTTTKQDNKDAGEDASKSKSKKKASMASLAKVASLEDKFDSILENTNGNDDDEEDGDDEEAAANRIKIPLNNVFSDLHGDDDYIDQEEKKVFSSTPSSSSSVSSHAEACKIFQHLKFFVNREVPLQWLQLCIISFGGQVGWHGNGSPFTLDDESVTHHIVDRPMTDGFNTSRDYVQPQWVFDSINARMRLPVYKYKPGVSLPPHLSPFVEDDKEGYLPKYREEIFQLQSAAGIASSKDEKKSVEKLEEDDQEDDEEEEADDDVGDDEVVVDAKLPPSSSKKKSVKQKMEEIISTADEDKSSAKKKGTKGVVFEPKQQKLSQVTFIVCVYLCIFI